MCRRHKIYFKACAHQDPVYNKTFPCSNYTKCGPMKLHFEYEPGFCCACLEDPKRLGLQAKHEYRYVGKLLEKRMKQLLSLAAEPGSRYRTFPNRTKEAEAHIYDSLDVNFFGHLEGEDGPWFNEVIDRRLSWYILDPHVPNLTENEFRLFRQIRMAGITYNLVEKETYFQRVEAGGDKRWIMNRLNSILTPVAVLKEEDRGRPICLDTLARPGTVGEPAVKLPCRHIYGRTCLETWINTRWVPGHPLAVCPSCRGHFDILYPGIRLPGVDGFQSDPPASSWWSPLLASAWQEYPLEEVAATGE